MENKTIDLIGNYLYETSFSDSRTNVNNFKKYLSDKKMEEVSCSRVIEFAIQNGYVKKY